eukprot:GHRR01009097.1.p1 GENE.GHRR01009097.1~~GHRR01009097.1.p1  ORF type:complete len:519 (+),score=156.17 GHRR01009097.1:211-1767(+)
MISLQRVCGTSQLATVVKGFRQLPVCLINTAIPVPSHYSAPCRPCCQASSPASSAAGQQQQRRQQQQQQAAPPRPLSGAEAAFYAQAASNFSELGVTQAIAEALEAAGFDRPSRVQELALPAILSGKDIVLAAETGSGKTLAYIAPITSVLAKLKQAAAAGADGGRQPKRQLAIVLCPNAALCQQVVRLVSSLQSPSGEPLLRACQVASSNPPPFEPPDVVVTTPGALVNLFNDRGFSYGSQWTAEGVSSRARFVVVDEADLLSQGGYVKDLMRLLDAFKAGERRVIESQVMEELGLSEDDIRRLPRHIRQACWDAGVPGMLKAGYKVRTQQQQLEQPADKVPMWSEDMKQQATVQDQLATGSNSTEDGSSSDPFVKRRASSSQASSRGHSSYGPYFRRQYLLVAATMPALTKGDVGVALQKRFKEAAWVSGDMLHQIKPHVQHQWVKVGEQGTEDALVQALQNDSDYQAQKARVLIFAKDTTAADNVSKTRQWVGCQQCNLASRMLSKHDLCTDQRL